MQYLPVAPAYFEEQIEQVGAMINWIINTGLLLTCVLVSYATGPVVVL
jgi:hypothetical protein